MIGISDKKRTLEGIDSVGEDRINEFINAPKDCCKPMPDYKEEILQIINTEGKADRLLLLHITGCPDRVIRTVNDATWLRIGDRTKEMLGENLRNLEYSKNARHFENELNQDATIMDLDQELLAEYQKKVNAEDIPMGRYFSLQRTSGSSIRIVGYAFCAMMAHSLESVPISISYRM